MVDNTDGVAGTYHVVLASTGAATVTSKPIDLTLAKAERKITTVADRRRG